MTTDSISMPPQYYITLPESCKLIYTTVNRRN